MNRIEHIIDPTRLLLVWQAPDGVERSKFVVGELLNQEGNVLFRYLPETEDFKQAQAHGFTCYPAFRKTDDEYSDSVMDSFLRRLPPRKRGDFAKYLAQWCIPSETELTDFSLLSYSGAKLPIDGFSIIWPFDEVSAPCEVLIEVAGFRYQKNVSINDLAEGMPVCFAPEPDNDKDPKAIRIEANGKRIGYVNRVQRDAVSHWLGRYAVEACIERLNGTADRPIVYVFCRLSESGTGQLLKQAAG